VHRTHSPLALVLLLALAQPALADPYELGRGYRIGDTGFVASGYLSLRADKLAEEPARYAVQDLSLLLHGDLTPLWHVFSEIELSNAVVYTRGGFEGRDADLDFERLYLDHNLSSRATLRLGKFLTPIGRWNQIHADPLVWTVSRPLTTSAAFARHATGAQLFGSQPWHDATLDFHAYLDDSGQFDPTEGQESTFLDVSVKPNPPSSFRHGAGVRAAYRSGDESLQLGVSAATYTLKDLNGGKRLLGADLFWSHEELEISGEAIYREDTRGQANDEWGGFLQLVAPLGRGFYGIASHERYQAALFPRPLNSSSLGLTYRPRPPFSVKLEYRQSSGEARLAPSGWLFSLAVLL
jgi:hypothetical protein